MGTDVTQPKRVEGLVGTVVAGPFGTGSKSERAAVWLVTDDMRLVLRRKSGPAYEDPALARYIGKRVRCDGFVVDYMLLAEQIEVLP